MSESSKNPVRIEYVYTPVSGAPIVRRKIHSTRQDKVLGRDDPDSFDIVDENRPLRLIFSLLPEKMVNFIFLQKY